MNALTIWAVFALITLGIVIHMIRLRRAAERERQGQR